MPTCLIVDDDATTRTVLTKLMAAQGWSARTAEDGEAAIDHCQSHTFDLVLMDCIMPVCDGLTATKRIREFAPALPIVAITSANNERDCADAGMNYYIAKPVSRHDLRLALDFLEIPTNNESPGR